MNLFNDEMNESHVAAVLQILAKASNANAVKKGFWEDEDQFIQLFERCAKSNGNEEFPFFDKDLAKSRIISLFNSEKIALEMSELAERLECLRKYNLNDSQNDEHCPDFLNVEIECADLIIRCLDFCGRRNLRIGEALIAKMKYNAGRSFKHGKQF